MRLSIELSPEEHHQIKMMAALQKKTIKDLVLGKIFGDERDEESAWQDLMLFLRNRITEAKDAGLSSKTPQQIARDILKRNNAI